MFFQPADNAISAVTDFHFVSSLPRTRPTTESIMHTRKFLTTLLTTTFFTATAALHAGEADLKIPPLDKVSFDGLGGIGGTTLMYLGIVMCAIGAIFGLVQYWQTKSLPVHKSMADVSQTIWETCKTYLFQQGKFLAIL
jgi:K(+)-stimulated pyrophosphate-energized sodium pump